MYRTQITFLSFLMLAPLLHAQLPKPTRSVLHRSIDLNIGESATVEVAGKKATVKLVELVEIPDDIRAAIRQARVKVEVDGQSIVIFSGNYHLPASVAGVRIDCPITKGYLRNSNKDAWGLDRDARIRIWPGDGPLIETGTFVYPVKQKWFASMTQMANEPVYVDGGERPSVKKIYYHYGLDIGGAEGMVDVVAATDGLVVSSGLDVLPGYKDTPVEPRYDVVYILDDRGWFYRYSHLYTIDPAIKPGARVRIGQKVGVLGKEGGSGGWSHLHFDITAKQPSGRWGIEEGYAFLWESYHREHSPKLIAVARPHHFIWTGQKVVLDGSKSWSSTGKIGKFEWKCTDGATATTPTFERKYDQPGVFSEILKITDSQGNVGYDFAVVQVLDRTQPDKLPPTVHAAYSPTFGIKAGDVVTFKVRSFRAVEPSETLDFGDGTPPVTVKSDGNVKQLAKDGYAVTRHTYEKPGHYLVHIVSTDRSGFRGHAHLHVEVGPKAGR